MARAVGTETTSDYRLALPHNSGWPASHHSPTGRHSSTTASSFNPYARRPAWRSRTSGCRRSCGRAETAGVARLVEATDTERRRIERDLHDGTQQRLVSIAMSLGLLESKLPGDPVAASPIVRETREALALALEELRELTQGIHPALLVKRAARRARGAVPAGCTARTSGLLRAAAPARPGRERCVLPGQRGSHQRRKARARQQVRIAVGCDGRALAVEIFDDGIGGAAPGGGFGLRGLSDRVEALGGRLTLSSPPGRGTTLRAEIPCA